MAVFKQITTTALLAVSLCASAPLPGEATVWTLKDFFPNFESASTCALGNDGTGVLTYDWYAVVEPLATCNGATSGTCWRRGTNASRIQGSLGSGYGWDYQTWSSKNQLHYFGFIIYRPTYIETLEMDSPESNVVLPASVNDVDSNPLWSNIYYNSGIRRYYDNSGNLLGSSTFGEYAGIVINKVDDPISGAPFVALHIESWSGPTASGPWTLGEQIRLRQTLLNGDAAKCGGTSWAFKGMYEWALGRTILFQTVDGWQYHP
jgi:hypothetical protein